MRIREYAKEHNHKVIGKLKRHPEYEEEPGEKVYMDEAGNEYWITKSGVCIATADDNVI